MQFFCVTLKCSENAKTFVTPFEKQCEFLTFGVLETQIDIYKIIYMFLHKAKVNLLNLGKKFAKNIGDISVSKLNCYKNAKSFVF